MRIALSHFALFIHDAHAWPAEGVTLKDFDQGFARVPSSVTLVAPLEDGWATLEFVSKERVSKCPYAFEVSVRADSGTLVMSGVDGERHVIWSGSPGWVRVDVGQMVDDDGESLHVLVRAVAAPAEAPTLAKVNGR